GCRALSETCGHETRHRSAEHQVVIGGSAETAGAVRYDPAPEDRICRTYCQMDRPAAANSQIGVEARSLVAIASMSLVATLGLLRRMRGLNHADSRHHTGSVRRIWRNCGIQSRSSNRTCRIATVRESDGTAASHPPCAGGAVATPNRTV